MNRIRIPRINIDVHGPCLYGRLRGALYLDPTGEFVDIWWTKTTCYLTINDARWLRNFGLISGRQSDSMRDASSHYHDGQRKRILGHVYTEEFNKRMLVNHDLRGCDFNDLKDLILALTQQMSKSYLALGGSIPNETSYQTTHKHHRSRTNYLRSKVSLAVVGYVRFHVLPKTKW